MPVELEKLVNTPWAVEFRRNPDGWLESARLSGQVLFYAPSSVWWAVGDNVLALLYGLFIMAKVILLLVAGLAVWAVVLPAQVVAGLLGFLILSKTETKDAG
jgi:hypothetical protein